MSRIPVNYKCTFYELYASETFKIDFQTYITTNWSLNVTEYLLRTFIIE